MSCSAARNACAGAGSLGLGQPPASASGIPRSRASDQTLLCCLALAESAPFGTDPRSVPPQSRAPCPDSLPRPQNSLSKGVFMRTRCRGYGVALPWTDLVDQRRPFARYVARAPSPEAQLAASQRALEDARSSVQTPHSVSVCIRGQNSCRITAPRESRRNTWGDTDAGPRSFSSPDRGIPASAQDRRGYRRGSECEDNEERGNPSRTTIRAGKPLYAHVRCSLAATAPPSWCTPPLVERDESLFSQRMAPPAHVSPQLGWDRGEAGCSEENCRRARLWARPSVFGQTRGNPSGDGRGLVRFSGGG